MSTESDEMNRYMEAATEHLRADSPLRETAQPTGRSAAMSTETGRATLVSDERIEVHEEAARRFVGKRYRIRPHGDHLGHVVTIAEAEPRDIGYFHAQCSCGDHWAISADRVPGVFEKYGEVGEAAEQAKPWPMPDEYEHFGCPDCGRLFTLPSTPDEDPPWCLHQGSYSWRDMKHKTRIGKHPWGRTVRVSVEACDE